MGAKRKEILKALSTELSTELRLFYSHRSTRHTHNLHGRAKPRMQRTRPWKIVFKKKCFGKHWFTRGEASPGIKIAKSSQKKWQQLLLCRLHAWRLLVLFHIVTAILKTVKLHIMATSCSDFCLPAFCKETYSVTFTLPNQLPDIM